MKVVLTQDVPDLGKAGEIKDVADEYARDYLLPKGYAAVGTVASIKQAQQIITVEEEEQVDQTMLHLMILDELLEDYQASKVLDLNPVEVELLQKINQGLPLALGLRYSLLIEKRDAEELTPDEHEELLSLTDQVEELESRRVEYLVELARLRNTTVTQLIQELDIRPFVYV